MNKLYNLLPIMSGVFFGTVGIFIRLCYDAGFNSITIIWTRFAGAVLLLGLYLLIKDRSLFRINPRDLWIFAVCGLVITTLTNSCFNVSATHLSLSLAATLLAIFPVYVLVVSAVFFHERVNAKKITCLLLAIAGCVLVTGVIGSDVVLSGIGLAAGILSGISYGMYAIVSRIAVNRGYRGYTITFYSMLTIAIGTMPFADYGAVAHFVSLAPVHNVGFMLLHSLCVGVLSYITYTISLEHIDPGKAAIFGSCEPVAAMVFGVILYKEIPTVFMVFGMILMLVALAVLGTIKDETRE